MFFKIKFNINIKILNVECFVFISLLKNYKLLIKVIALNKF